MIDYLNNIEFAVTKILEAIWHEDNELKKLTSEISTLFIKSWNGYPGVLPIHTDKNGKLEIKITGKPPSTFLSEDLKGNMN